MSDLIEERIKLKLDTDVDNTSLDESNKENFWINKNQDNGSVNLIKYIQSSFKPQESLNSSTSEVALKEKEFFNTYSSNSRKTPSIVQNKTIGKFSNFQRNESHKMPSPNLTPK